jgi:hypothetical protein
MMKKVDVIKDFSFASQEDTKTFKNALKSKYLPFKEPGRRF